MSKRRNSYLRKHLIVKEATTNITRQWPREHFEHSSDMGSIADRTQPEDLREWLFRALEQLREADAALASVATAAWFEYCPICRVAMSYDGAEHRAGCPVGDYAKKHGLKGMRTGK